MPGTHEELFAISRACSRETQTTDAVAALIGEDDDYAGIVDTLRAIGAQHPGSDVAGARVVRR